MLPVLGPWSDTAQVTDTTLLLDLSARSRDTAVGVLANRNLTGPQLGTVLERAHFTVANVDAVDAAAIMERRAPADQAAIVLTAQRKSEPAASRLAHHLSPLGVLEVYDYATTHRLRGAATLTQTLRWLVANRGWLRFFGEPGFAEVAERVNAPTQPRLLACTALSLMGDRDALTDFTTTLAAAEEPRPGWLSISDEDLNSLLLATAGHRDVVAHWAQHGGAWGLLVAAMDHRHGSALVPHLGDVDTTQILIDNPAIEVHARARIVGDLIARACTAGLDGMRDLHILHAQAQRLAAATAWDGPDVTNPAHVPVATLTGNYARNAHSVSTRLLDYDILTTRSDLPGSLVGQVAQSLASVPADLPLPDAVHQTLLSAYAEHGNAYDFWSKSTMASRIGTTPPRPAPTPNYATVHAFAIESDVKVDETTGILTLPAARLIASRLSTGAEYVDFYARRDEAANNITIGDLLDAAADPTIRVHAPADIHDVLGNALGSW